MTEIQTEPSKCRGTLGPHRSYIFSDPTGRAAVSGSVGVSMEICRPSNGLVQFDRTVPKQASNATRRLDRCGG